MTPLDQKINQHFPGLVVRKDLVKAVKGNAIVPSFVLEYLLGQYCASSDEDTIQAGIESVGWSAKGMSRSPGTLCSKPRNDAPVPAASASNASTTRSVKRRKRSR